MELAKIALKNKEEAEAKAAKEIQERQAADAKIKVL